MSESANAPIEVHYYAWGKPCAATIGFMPLDRNAEGFYSLTGGAMPATESQALQIIQRQLTRQRMIDSQST